MPIYKTRYLAKRERKSSPFHDGSERIVKVDGGYAIMKEFDYQTFKKQK